MTYSEFLFSFEYWAERFRTDKGKKYHGYIETYAKVLYPIQDRIKSILEIGLGNHESLNREGESIFIWAGKFPDAKVVGIDIDQKNVDYVNYMAELPPFKNAKAYCMDQVDPSIADLGPFDLIVDDASHINDLTATTFHNLFPSLNPGGIYVIEDVYAPLLWKSWGGSGSYKYTIRIEGVAGMESFLPLQRVDNFPESDQYKEEAKRSIKESFPHFDMVKSIMHTSGLIIIEKK